MNSLQLKLRERFHYDPDTGAFTYAVSNPGIRAVKGQIAGTISKTGLQQVYFDRKTLPIGNLIIMYMEGTCPSYTGRRDSDNRNTKYDNIYVSEIRCVNQRRRANKPKIKSDELSKCQRESIRMYPFFLEFHRIMHKTMIDYQPLALNHHYKLHV